MEATLKISGKEVRDLVENYLKNKGVVLESNAEDSLTPLIHTGQRDGHTFSGFMCRIKVGK